ncbi:MULTISPECIES: squalene/phytoene synthase family protein [Oleiagrimonas]|uniref:Phytoene synthase n=1 Tax=Oleiagrimonas citrea TaxID=1665687 RepID=A0A846ZF54_9GAMM|nr:squalene/phytoene synthase family protein [Oleiagrimonas sp. MCCC 1A03011]NKZ37705.1 phytoene synthase [Oleiagrimonas citrea]RAP56367.1 phytoene synthase [Oleiagrimonas sp. MCCC 1A03011]
MSDDALHSYLQKWLQAQPAQRLALPFVDESGQAGHLALAALEQEWVDAAYGIRESHVAQVKLNWWAEELSGAAASGGRHPLTQVLFAAPEIARIEPSDWLAPIQAAMAQQDLPTPADFAEQRTRAQAFHGAWANLETRWWFGVEAEASRAGIAATADHLLHALVWLDTQVDHDRLALPMARLARHGLDRSALASDSAERRAALRDQLDDIAALLRDAQAHAGPLSLFRGLQMRENARLIRRARRAADPLARLREARAKPAPGSVFRAWSAARAWRRQARI